MKTILVPTDFSDNARNALDYAISLAKARGRKILLLSAYYIPSSSGGMLMNIRTKIKEEAEKSMDRLVKQIRKEFAESGNELPELEAIVAEGSTVDTILHAAETYESTAIVMGTTGSSGLEGRIMGSNTTKIINDATIPVLAVPEKANFRGFEDVVYATDKLDADDIPFKKLQTLLEAFNPKITLLHVLPTSEKDNPAHAQTVEEFKKSVQNDNVKVVLEFSDDVTAGISSYVQNSSTTLLAMVTHQRGFFAKVFDPSLTRKVALHAEVPLLVFHA